MRSSSAVARAAVSIITIVGLLLISACQGKPATNSAQEKVKLSASRKIYSDVESVAKDSSLIVRGQLDRIVARTVDDGGSDGKAVVTVPTILFEMSDYQVGGDSRQPLGKIIVAWPDTDKIESDELVPLSLGQGYVLFLEKVDEEERGGLKEYGTLYVPVSSIAGVFQIVNETSSVASDPGLVSLEKSGPPAKRQNDRMTANPEDLLSLVPGLQ